MSTLNELAKELIKENELLSQYNKQVADQKMVVEDIKLRIMTKMSKEQMSSTTVDGVRLTVAKHMVPDVQDWNKLYDYIYSHKAFDMLHKRVTIAALQDRLDAMSSNQNPVDIMGVRLINQPILKVTK